MPVSNSSPFRPVALVCALEYEIAPLVRNWRKESIEHDERKFSVFESEDAVAAAAGIGKEFARIAAKAMVETYHPFSLISCGLAGSLVSVLSAGETVLASRVIDAETGKRWPAAQGDATLVTANVVAGRALKQQMASEYNAQLIDMEAAAVAEVAAQSGIRFLAAKAISDPRDFKMPPLQQFIRPDGSFSNLAFAAHIAIRPWLWIAALQLARNSGRAVAALEHLLRQLINNEIQAAKAVKSVQGGRSS